MKSEYNHNILCVGVCLFYKFSYICEAEELFKKLELFCKLICINKDAQEVNIIRD